MSASDSSAPFRYRFRVRSADGQEIVSDVFSGPKQDHSDKLGQPKWSAQHFGHGERAGMEVEAKGLDGKQINFVIEHLDGETWTHYKDLLGSVKGGKATVQIELHHPKVKGGADPRDVEAADLRFRCEVVD